MREKDFLTSVAKSMLPDADAVRREALAQNAHTTPRKTAAFPLKKAIALAACLALVITGTAIAQHTLRPPLGHTLAPTETQRALSPPASKPSPASQATATATAAPAADSTGKAGEKTIRPETPKKSGALPKAPTVVKPLGSFAMLEKALVELQSKYNYRQSEYGYTTTVRAAVGADAFGATPEKAADSTHGTTNTQVANVDEADILKNDGKYLYYATDTGAILIMQAAPAEALKLVATIAPGAKANAQTQRQLYVTGNRLAELYSDITEENGKYLQRSTARIFDITDRASPKLVRSYTQDGYLLNSRMLDGAVYLITQTFVPMDFVAIDGKIGNPETVLPRCGVNGKMTALSADKIACLPDVTEPSYLIIGSVSLTNKNAQPETAAVLGGGGNLYMNEKAIFIAETVYQQAAEKDRLVLHSSPKTRIHRFDVFAGGLVQYTTAGEVPGTPLNQFSMDEHGGYLRIATTEETDHVSNRITVLDQTLKTVGSVTGIAPGERIQSARFVGNTGYLVTFLRTDPLYTVDLSKPAAPKLLGELKIPGFSAYLHPWGDKYLIGVGPDGDDNGTNGGTKISLFDVSDLKNPREVDKYTIPDSSSSVEYDHKAFTGNAAQNQFAIPVMRYNMRHSQSGCLVFEVINGKLRHKQSLQLATDYVQRATYIGQSWYLCGQNSAAAFAIESGKTLSTLHW
ncbi:MAG: beta-propeller domain-containing protein [Oscillospiraceae bacterium]|jgi:uncharacterized secreted protein with C-terminal beta-propeller domain|nr:beta-propeller domain-containing protein [Oscillospiraceae bacterium]